MKTVAANRPANENSGTHAASTLGKIEFETPSSLDGHASQSGTLRSRDAAWEAELLGVLSDMEQRLGQLTRQKSRAWPPEAVRLGSDLLRAVAEFAEAKFAEHPHARKHLEAARAEASCILNAADGVVRDAGPEPTRWGGLFGGAKKLSAGHRDTCYWALRALPAALECYLLVLGCGYATGPAAGKWVETRGVFLTQAKRVLSAVEKG